MELRARESANVNQPCAHISQSAHAHEEGAGKIRVQNGMLRPK